MSINYLKPIEIDIVIISWAKNEKLHKETLKCLDSLCNSESSEKIKFNIVVVESDKETSYNHIDTNGHNITTICTDVEFGYHTYLNIGLNVGNAKWTCLCNNDLVFNKHWASEILALIHVQRQHDPKGWEYVSASPANPIESWHKERLGQIIVGYGVRQHIAGWCLFQSRNVIEKIGGLEERIKFWFCDNWYSVALQHNKIPHIFVGTSIVQHHNDLEGTTTKDADMTSSEKHKVTYGAGDEFREIVREMLNDESWGRPTDELKEKLKKGGKPWY